MFFCTVLAQEIGLRSVVYLLEMVFISEHLNLIISVFRLPTLLYRYLTSSVPVPFPWTHVDKAL